MSKEIIRLDKYLADCNIGTRSEVKKYIRKGRVSVNGVIVRDADAKVTLSEDTISMDDHELSYESYHYYMLNKPVGCVSATRDGLSKTVLEYLVKESTDGLFPVGRLDKDAEGLLLITDDGALAHNLLSPKKHVDKKYLVISDTKLCIDAEEKFLQGIDIGEDTNTLPATLSKADIDFVRRMQEKCAGDFPRTTQEKCAGDFPRTMQEKCADDFSRTTQKQCADDFPEGDGYAYEVTIAEGRFHQVKKMIAACGGNVVFLKRVSMGPLCLDENLLCGQYRRLTEEEVSMLRACQK